MIRGEMIADYLHRAGVLIERHRRAGLSIHQIDDPTAMIIQAAMQRAIAKGATKDQINAAIMAGERDWEKVLAPIKVVAVFAYYWDPIDGRPAMADYLIRESNHPALPEGGNVQADALMKAGIKVPKTPTYEKWIRSGRKAVRS